MNKVRILTIAAALLFVAGGAVSYIRRQYLPAVPVVQKNPLSLAASPAAPVSKTQPAAAPKQTAATLLLKIPFTPQAPTANWDSLHNEDCEEAAAIMADAYFNGDQTSAKLDAAYVESRLKKLTDWEMGTLGYNLDINSEETAHMITANYALQAKVETDFDENTIQQELSQNHVVLMPENGQLLGNPNYKRPGPKYHMLVVKGYTPSAIITNDSGTRNGLNYSYSYDTLYAANGEWDHKTSSVDLNKKNIIVVWK